MRGAESRARAKTTGGSPADHGPCPTPVATSPVFEARSAHRAMPPISPITSAVVKIGSHMDLLETMSEFRREASWAVWETDPGGNLTGEMQFPLDQAPPVINGRAMFVSLNPGSDRATETAETTPDWSNFHSQLPKHNDVFLAEAIVGTPFWGSYMTDLHPDIAESDSRLIRSKPEEIELSVLSLISQGQKLGDVKTLICVGNISFDSVIRYSSLLQTELGLPSGSIVRIPHYSRAAAGVHKHVASRYRALVHEALVLA